MRTIDDLAAEWEGEWLPTLRREIHELHLRKEVHNELIDALVRNGHGGSVFGDLFHRMYLDSQLMAIRRQTDDDPRTVSLHRLFGQLEQAASQFTRTWWVNRWVKGAGAVTPEAYDLHTGLATSAFDEFCDRAGAAKLGKGRLAADRQELKNLTTKVVEHVNVYVAHTSRHPGQVTVTYAEFDAAIEHLGKMLQRYVLLIGQDGLLSPTPVVPGDPLAALRHGLPK